MREIICLCIFALTLFSPCSCVNVPPVNDLSDLRALISAYEDTRISVRDLAFYLVSHNYDAAPKDGYVQLLLDGKIYRLTPNGDAPGLCDILQE
ncbi:MAG TPA: hypothetical protein PKK11_00255 [Methanothrix sp.]|nr:hypothetical protein [Methanothrix sp.]HPT18811.1 hypothetical protein [Methanothrix sp.]